MKDWPIKICIFGRTVLALEGKSSGGAELQKSLLARALALNGHDVIVLDPENAKEFITTEGIVVQTIKEWSNGIRGVRTFTHRIPKLITFLKNQHVDAVYVRGFHFWYFVLLLISKRLKSKFILACAHDSDALGFCTRYSLFYSHNLNVWEWISNYMPSELAAPWILKYADLILVQNVNQYDALTKRGERPLIFRNIIEEYTPTITINQPKNGYIIVGALNVRKGLPQMIRLVTDCADHNFIIIGPATDSEGKKAYKTLKKLPNVNLLGKLDRNETMNKIAGAKALVNTSSMEGFPNTFLEAWSLGIPVLSLIVNPDNIFNRYEVGEVCNGDLELLKRKIIHFNNRFSSEIMKAYVRKNHGFITASSRFNLILKERFGQ